MPPRGETKETTLNNLERFSTSAVSVADSLQAKADLEWIANRWNDLKARLVPSTTPNSGAGRPAPSSRPPLNLHISDLMFEIEYEARMLGHTLLQETHNWRPRSSAMPQLLRDVAEMHGHWTTQPDQVALVFTDWAREYRHRVERALENPPNPTYLGPCACLGDMYLRPGTRLAKCRLCGNSVAIETQMEYVHEVLRGRLMTLSEIRAALKLLDLETNYATIRKWAERKRIIPETEGGKLYRLADAIELAQQTRQRKRSA